MVRRKSNKSPNVERFIYRYSLTILDIGIYSKMNINMKACLSLCSVLNTKHGSHIAIDPPHPNFSPFPKSYLLITPTPPQLNSFDRSFDITAVLDS